MAPVRRRVSRRVVKSTFQECFEYDIPGLRAAKRPVLPVPTGRTSVSSGKIKRTKINDSKEASTSKDVKLTSTNNVNKILKRDLQQKDKVGDVALKEKQKRTVIANKNSETINKLQRSVVKRVKAKKAFMGSDYKRFKSAQNRSVLKEHLLSTKILEKETAAKHEARISSSPLTTISEESKTASSVESVFDSKNWQPVVHLEKLNVDDTESSKSTRKNRQSHIRQHVHSSASCSSELIAGIQNDFRYLLTNRNDHDSLLSSQGMSKRTSSGHLRSTQSTETGSNSVLSEMALDSGSAVCREKRGLSKGVIDGILKHSSSVGNQAASDSAMEDWPDDSSEASDLPEPKDSADHEKVTPEHDWVSPHVSRIMHWQEQFSCVANDLRNTFDHLSSIIEEKNASINILRKKLEHYSDNSYHSILDKILQDYDKYDVNKPATVILNSILEYSNTSE